ncbi:MAG: glycoside hydrolase family 9 protein [Draconibacterium sp.]
MRKIVITTGIFLLINSVIYAVDVIRINQLGYLPNSVKVAVFLSSEEKEISIFTVCSSLSNKVVFTGKPEKKKANDWGMKTALRLNFSEVNMEGDYYIKVGETRSPAFRINANVYEGTADFILNYMRQQRCGYNPFLKDSCHTHDGIIVDHPTKSGEFINVTGGWHDATDYLQYSTTSVNAVFQMMFAYENFPKVYSDKFDANGSEGANGIPDILDEIKWGLEWMLKMNPAPDEMYNQIADDRDHIGFKMPTGDKSDYGMGEYRPVYFVTGKPQGLAKFKNESTGVSSIAGKFASGFALGARLFEKSDPELSKQLKQKALDAWNFALSDTGYCQTACNISPYYYEESNYADDLELAAAQLYQLTGKDKFLKEANYWGKQEPVSPWVKNDTAGHYASYPFVNLGHYFVSKNEQEDFTDFYKEGLELLYNRGKNDPFFYGLPFLWCSNNLVAAAITHARLYEKQTGNKHFVEMEAALRDWLFGCNPWGTAMICGLPGVEDSPLFPHSSYTVLLGGTTPGGLIDGPIDAIRNKQQIGIVLQKPDVYAAFNNGIAVYHDDVGDYSTNEPTMDGTASLSFYLAFLETEGERQSGETGFEKDSHGAVIRINPEKRNIYLVFTADSLFEGGDRVLEILKENQIKGSFFLTGNFLRNRDHKKIIKKMIKEGHYVGAHSDKHLLYCDWTNRDSTLVSFEQFRKDVENNFAELKKFGITKEDASIFLPAYEWYNHEIVQWSSELGLELINFTPGTGTNADYTTPKMKDYKTSAEIWRKLKIFEEYDSKHLNGAILLIHPGTEPARKDKFYNLLDVIIEYLYSNGYRFLSLKD